MLGLEEIIFIQNCSWCNPSLKQEHSSQVALCHHCTTPFMIKAQRHSKQNEIAPLFANKNISISTQKDLEQNPGTWKLQMEDRKNKTTVQKAMNQIECNPHPRYQYNLTQTENWPFILQFQLQQRTFMTLHLLQLD